MTIYTPTLRKQIAALESEGPTSEALWLAHLESWASLLPHSSLPVFQDAQAPLSG
jgi:hypothetical protein